MIFQGGPDSLPPSPSGSALGLGDVSATDLIVPLSPQARYLKDQYAICIRLVPHVDKAPLPLRILRLVTSNFLPVENPTHPTAHAPERASVYILGQFRTSK